MAPKIGSGFTRLTVAQIKQEVKTSSTQTTPKFGSVTANKAIWSQPKNYKVTVDYNSKNFEKTHGTNVYDYLNGINVNINLNNTSKVNSLDSTPASSAGVVANTSKSSAEVLSSVTNSGTYGELSAAKTELAVGVDNLTSDFNDSSSNYIDEDAKATLSELGIEVPSLGQISGEFDDYDKDMETFDKGLDSCQGVQDEANKILPDISNKKCVAKSKVDSYKAQSLNLKAQIIAAKLSKQDTSELEAKLAEVKQKLAEAKEEYSKYKKQEKALNTAITQSQQKKEAIEQNKVDLTNYHEAESQVVDKTYQIAQDDDSKLNEAINKLKQKKNEIKQAAQDTNGSVTNGSDDFRNERLEQLQKEYQKLAIEATDIFVDLDQLVADNDNKKSVNNSTGNVYTINYYDDAKKILEEGF